MLPGCVQHCVLLYVQSPASMYANFALTHTRHTTRVVSHPPAIPHHTTHPGVQHSTPPSHPSCSVLLYPFKGGSLVLFLQYLSITPCTLLKMCALEHVLNALAMSVLIATVDEYASLASSCMCLSSYATCYKQCEVCRWPNHSRPRSVLLTWVRYGSRLQDASS